MQKQDCFKETLLRAMREAVHATGKLQELAWEMQREHGWKDDGDRWQPALTRGAGELEPEPPKFHGSGAI